MRKKRTMRQHLLDEGLHLNLKVTRPNQVWSIDITYVPMAHGHMYLVAIIDVFSRRILSWKLGNTLDASESVEVLQQAIARFGTPERGCPKDRG